MKKYLCKLSIIPQIFFSPLLLAGNMGTADYSQLWSGVYIGANVGAIWGNLHGDVTIPSSVGLRTFLPTSNNYYQLNQTSALGGGQLGINWQLKNFVIGTEVTVDGFNLNQTRTIQGPDGHSVDLYVAGDSYSSKNTFQATWVGRIGKVIHNDWLLYFTGGGALTPLTVSTNHIVTTIDTISYPHTSGSTSKTLFGGVVGGGLEKAISKNFRLGVEYRYIDYPSRTFNQGVIASTIVALPADFVYTPTSAKMKLSTNQVTFRLSYKFDNSENFWQT